MNKHNEMNRRQFFKLAGLASVASTVTLASGCSSKQSGPSLSGGEVNFTQETDVLVVGAGPAGLFASLALAKAGVPVLTLEKQPSWGGDAILACGVILGYQTAVQKQQGIETPTLDEVFEQRKTKTVFTSDNMDIERMVLENTQRIFDMWVNDYGVEFMDMTGPAWKPSFHVVKEGLQNVQKLLGPVYEDAAAKGAEFMFETRAISLIQDENNSVVGVRARDEVSGETFDIQAKKVVLAAGDYVSNQELVCQYNQMGSDVIPMTPNSMGEGLLMGAAAGGALCNMGAMVGIGPTFIPIQTVGLFDSVMHLSPDGHRIGNESTCGAIAYQAKGAGYRMYWTLFGEGQRTGRHSATYEKQISKGGVVEAATVEELAEQTRMPLETLKATLEKFNTDAANGREDTEFGKAIGIDPIEPPFYAVWHYPVRFKAVGGLMVDSNFQVLDPADDPIANLHAVGCSQGVCITNIHQASSEGLFIGEHLAGELA